MMVEEKEGSSWERVLGGLIWSIGLDQAADSDGIFLLLCP